jgi:dolichol-phosphate mannosyltransferase
MQKLGIIIPAYNEDRQVIRLVKEINKKIIINKILIVDDSVDSKIKNIHLLFNNVIYLNRKKKLGRGSAVILGLRILKKFGIDTFIEMDADFSHNPNELKKNILIYNKKKLDLLISSRYLKKSKIIDWPISRKIFSKISNLLAKFLLKIPVSDYTNGYRIYSNKATNIIISKCGKIGDGFIILSEILMELHLNKLNIDETSTIFVNRKRGESSVNMNLIYKSFIGLIKIYLKKRNYYSNYRDK